MVELDCRTGWIFSWKVSVQDASVRGTKPNCWVRQGNPKARGKPAQVATTRLPPPRDPHLDPAIQPPNCQHDHFPPSSMWTNTISSWSHGQCLTGWLIISPFLSDHLTTWNISWLSSDHLIVRNTTVAPCENFIYQCALCGYLGVLINRSLVVCYWFHELLINCI